jgi:tRNA (guanine-N7-)-methyltransferase
MHEDRKQEAATRAFFGRRKGHKLRRGRAQLMTGLLPKLALDLAVPAPADLRSLFSIPVKDVALEIGFGAGENFVREAVAEPVRGFIGCEAFENGMATALASIEANNLQNVRLHYGDAIELVDWLPEQSIARADILYPDPWPKRRHWKRRIISDSMLERLARVLRSGALLRFATDIPGYTSWTLQHFLRSPNFEWTAGRADDWRKPWQGFESTRYEAKALREGRTPCYLIFRRF